RSDDFVQPLNGGIEIREHLINLSAVSSPALEIRCDILSGEHAPQSLFCCFHSCSSDFTKTRNGFKCVHKVLNRREPTRNNSPQSIFRKDGSFTLGQKVSISRNWGSVSSANVFVPLVQFPVPQSRNKAFHQVSCKLGNSRVLAGDES